ncbi:hypothetical protein TNIN_480731 [Trichonephila inaurata madagascariensis]|uniref:Uncharacterized protein n=1 Tax=Trichonephila inaurata madagascariensis TaxID=2747483 RepID=A0A8X7BV07_9ARAC|nr:hypothetical protein TNIN_480731 [Trichonephila inaurata madagascariensis]
MVDLWLSNSIFSFCVSRTTAVLQGEAAEHSCGGRTDSGAAMQDRQSSGKCAMEQRWFCPGFMRGDGVNVWQVQEDCRSGGIIDILYGVLRP